MKHTPPDSVTCCDSDRQVGICRLTPRAILAETTPTGNPPPIRVSANTHNLGPDRLAAGAKIVNTGDYPLRIAGIRWTYPLDPGYSLAFPREDRPRYFATENFRSDWFAAGTTFGDSYFEPLTNQTVEVGWSSDNGFPGLFVAAEAAPKGFFCAQASQRRFHAIFRFRGFNPRGGWLFEIEEKPTGLPFIELQPGDPLEGETFFFDVVATNDPQQATDAYYEHLRAEGCFRRLEKNPLSDQRIYCSWNYDFFKDITEKDLLAQIPIVKKHFPSVNFIQLDDGYQHEYAKNQRAMIDLCYKLDEPFNREKFPSGPKGLADRIRAQGLRPAIWLGLWCSQGSPMLEDHPDWFLQDDTGAPMLFDRFYKGTAILDPSVPEVREYLDRVCKTVFGEWGYEGVKLDFSSFAFNCKRIRYRVPDKTAVELRHELEAIFRRHLPEDGFFGWCVVTGTGQPFLTQADYFRAAVDVGHGDWKCIKEIAKWLANTVALLQQSSCLPNADSLGWSEQFDDNQWQAWLNLAAVSGMALEISGDLRKLDESRLQKLNHALELSRPESRLRVLDLPRGRIETPPAVWFSENTRRGNLLALFNWGDGDSKISLDDFELTGTWTDAWKENSEYVDTVTLSPGQSRLLLITK
ncbi:MAG: alpha-galactosidase [Verrucomicrobiota bacterium]